jgi:hypothetical protein
MAEVIYIIYEIDDDVYWTGGTNWSWDVQQAFRLKSIGEAEAAIQGLYRRNSRFNLMYKQMRVIY